MSNRSHNIWNEISGQEKYSSADFGSAEGFTQATYVGTGPHNSHLFARIKVERFVKPDGSATFSLYLDGKLVKRGTLTNTQFEIERCTIEGAKQAD